MRHAICVAAMILGCSLAAGAQELAKFEASFGYTWLRRDVGPKHISMSGVDAEAVFNWSPRLALVGDFSLNVAGPKVSGPSKTQFNVESFLFGPQISSRRSRLVRPFARALVGGTRIAVNDLNVSLHTSDVGFAWALGGGVDLRVNDWVDFRVVQGDYFGTHNFGSTQTNLRLTFGFNFRFGQK